MCGKLAHPAARARRHVPAASSRPESDAAAAPRACSPAVRRAAAFEEVVGVDRLRRAREAVDPFRHQRCRDHRRMQERALADDAVRVRALLRSSSAGDADGARRRR